MKHRVAKFKLRKQYGESLSLKGVYCFWFAGHENMIYVGRTKRSFKARVEEHFHRMTNGTSKKIIHDYYCRAMINSFRFKILEVVRDNNLMLKREEFYINKLNPKLNKIKKIIR